MDARSHREPTSRRRWCCTSSTSRAGPPAPIAPGSTWIRPDRLASSRGGTGLADTWSTFGSAQTPIRVAATVVSIVAALVVLVFGGWVIGPGRLALGLVALVLVVGGPRLLHRARAPLERPAGRGRRRRLANGQDRCGRRRSGDRRAWRDRLADPDLAGDRLQQSRPPEWRSPRPGGRRPDRRRALVASRTRAHADRQVDRRRDRARRDLAARPAERPPWTLSATRGPARQRRTEPNAAVAGAGWHGRGPLKADQQTSVRRRVGRSCSCAQATISAALPQGALP